MPSDGLTECAYFNLEVFAVQPASIWNLELRDARIFHEGQSIAKE